MITGGASQDMGGGISLGSSGLGDSHLMMILLQ